MPFDNPTPQANEITSPSPDQVAHKLNHSMVLGHPAYLHPYQTHLQAMNHHAHMYLQPPNEDTLRVLVEARRRLEKPFAWMKGTAAAPVSVAPGGIARCAGETVFEVSMTRNTQYAPAHNALIEAIPPGWGASIPGYNDHPDTTLDMVLAWFDRAIANERAKLAA